MKALITGAAGFVGRHFVRALLADGWDVHSVDLEPTEVAVDWNGPAHLHVAQDVMRYFSSTSAFAFDLVVHAAARAPHRAAIDGQPATTVYNRLLDAAMFDWAVRTGQRRVLYLSSSAVYPAVMQRSVSMSPRLEEDDALADNAPPPDAYGWSKLSGEQTAACAAAAGVAVHVVRPFSGYGEGQSEDYPFGAFVARAARREDPFTIWGDGAQVRDWIHVSDLVAGALAVVGADERRPVNLCTGRGTSMLAVARTVCAAAGYEPEFAFDLGAPSGVAHRVGDPSRMREIFTPTVGLADAARRAVAAAAGGAVR